ncbi:phage tail tape measure C-terminal domain-containing protein [Psychrobacter sp. FDAARGOS_221]|uniref:phage tail tape measure C-terminal domain-containing protein n=1 Tax=Psychrobacter sp. FDAARGOS_221 TaxID=1975705 RepID=UPI000BB54504|nr:phage tail tape measure C-terminal domain-containing protein [Psychrobacter sp. FDAARGOS_221]PNK59468.1 hypothetical protein A6J60_000235 [Psychrobacter sp. FDAARGOS_221]PNK61463.1 hypothetical protein A6J60_011710 [Psychrobacter sp. FDAARGOS_221]
MAEELKFGLVISADGTAAIRTLEELEDGLNDVDKTSDKAGKSTSTTFDTMRQRAMSFGGTLANVAKKVTMFGGVVGTLAGALSLNSLVDTQRQFDVLNSQLVTATGGTKEAAAAFDELTKFASTTPYALEQSVSGFVQLKNLGLDPSMRSMQSYGNFAAAMGKDLNQMIEAVADASTFEFERLKEFGIKASQQGNKVAFTFQGVTTTVGKNSKEIQEYLLAIGETKFGDAMANRAKTLDGALSNLGDNFNSLKLAVVQSGIGDVIQDIVIRASDGLARMTDALREPENAAKLKSAIESVGDAFNQLQGFVDQAKDVIAHVIEVMSQPENIERMHSALDALGDAFNDLKDFASQTIDVIGQVTDFLIDNKEIVIALASGVAAAASAFLLLNGVIAAWTAIGTAATAVTTAFGIAVGIATSPVTLILAAIAGLVAVGVYLYRNWDELSAKASEVWQGIKNYVSEAWEGVKAKTSEVWEGIKSKVAEVWDGIKQKVVDTVAGLPQPVQDMITNIQSMFTGIKDLAVAAFEFVADKALWAVEQITVIWQGAKEVFSTVWDGLSAAASVVFESIKGVVATGWEAIKSTVSAGVDIVVSVTKVAFDGLKTAISNTWDGIKAFARDGWQALKAIFTAGITAVAIVFNTGFNTVKTVVKTAFNAIKALAKGDIEGFKTTIKSGLDKLKGIAKTAISQFVDAFGTLGSKLLQIGRDAVQGLINGVKEKISGAIDVARNLASSVSDTVKNFFVIRSPSRLFKKFGEWLSIGLGLGIKGKQSEAVQAALNLAQNIYNAMSGIKKDIALFGKNSELASFDYDRANGMYKGIKDSVLNSYRNLIKAKEDLIKLDAEINKVNEFTIRQQTSLEQYAFETSLIGKQADEVERLRFSHNLLNQAKQDGKDLSEQAQQQLLATTQQIIAQREELVALRTKKQEAEKMADFTARQQSALEKYAFETSLIGKQADEVERLRFERNLLNQAEQAGITLSEQATQKIIAQREELIELRKQQQALQDNNWVDGLQSGFQSLSDGAKSLNETMQQATTGAFNKMSDSFSNFVATGKGSFKDLTASILQDISKMLIKFAMLRVAKMAVGMFEDGGAFAGSGLLELAKGGAFNNQGIQYYANGDIFNKPTAFRHAGGLGVMGEAGPEAVMPLTRGPNGKLGVQVFNSKQNNQSAGVVNQVKIDIHINSDGASADVQTTTQDSKQLAESLKAVVLQTLQNEIRPGGMLAPV